MWILHQNKEIAFNLEKAIGIRYSVDLPLSPLHEKRLLITYYGAANKDEIIMGKYPTKERCLEVIQDIMKNLHLKNLTYEMPEK